MLRLPIHRALIRAGASTRAAVRSTGTVPAKAPEKIEVFIDDKPVLVDPGTTILQVITIQS